MIGVVIVVLWSRAVDFLVAQVRGVGVAVVVVAWRRGEDVVVAWVRVVDECVCLLLGLVIDRSGD